MSKIIDTGAWGDHITWKLYATTELPPVELITATLCVAVSDGGVILARSERGWGLLGGHIEDGETIEASLIREAQEEGGFTPTEFQLFAVREVTAAEPIPHQDPTKTYPFPTSYLVYYWATTNSPILMPTGEEIIESARFSLEELVGLSTPDQLVIEAGYQAFLSARSPSIQAIRLGTSSQTNSHNRARLTR